MAFGPDAPLEAAPTEDLTLNSPADIRQVETASQCDPAIAVWLLAEVEGSPLHPDQTRIAGSRVLLPESAIAFKTTLPTSPPF